MRNQTLVKILLMSMLTTFSSCALVEGIFKAGMGVGIFIMILVIALIIFIFSRLGKNK